ncbi:MAG: metalloregulator ArsR/SmtB family transcription factor [Lentisphaeria bacterium]|nr:metalloregulator ArsR/SmtB family transcription factor [Lentisphaeria bacterium]
MNDTAKLFKALADDTRLRIVRLLSREELNVYEIGRILSVPQPSVSRHLSALKGVGLVTDRRDGPRSFYSLVDHPETLTSIEAVLHEVAAQDHPDLQQLEAVVAARALDSQTLMDEKAEHWDEIIGLLHSSSASLLAIANMTPRGLVIGDLGTGTGPFLPVLSAMAEAVHAVDQSAAMLRRAKKRCREANLKNITFHQTNLMELPCDLPACDALLMHFVLHQVARPANLLKRIPACLKPGGRFIMVDSCAHEDERARDMFGSVWLGFSQVAISQWLREAGMRVVFWEEVAGKGTGKHVRRTFVCAGQVDPAVDENQSV